MRFALDHALNLRPVKLLLVSSHQCAARPPESIDMIVCREGTEGLYCGAGGFLRKDTEHEVATEESINTWFGVQRLVRGAFERAAARPRKKLTTRAQDERAGSRRESVPAGRRQRRGRLP